MKQPFNEIILKITCKFYMYFHTTNPLAFIYVFVADFNMKDSCIFSGFTDRKKKFLANFPCNVLIICPLIIL